MKLKFFLIPLFMMCYSPSVYADEGLNISYTVPLIPLEIVFDSDGISFNGKKTIVTPIGSFSLGYSIYASKFDEDYTYVIIEDMNLKKEHIYKIKDKKKLKLITEGRTEITITKNRVRIVVEKGSHFTVKFSVEGEENNKSKDFSFKDMIQDMKDASISMLNMSKDKIWITPSNSVCKSNGGKADSYSCKTNWGNAKKICSASGGRLPTIDELKKVVTDCGGTIDDTANNIANSSYQSCYKEKGFTSDNYWSSTTYESYIYHAWYVQFSYGWTNNYFKPFIRSVYCVRAGE